MKKTSLGLVLIILIINGKIMAQAKESVPAKKIIEQGTKGDLILTNENKKNQLNEGPQLLQQEDSVRKATLTRPKNKCKPEDGRNRK